MGVTAVFSSAGRRVGLIECFRADARELGHEFKAVATDIEPEWSSACAVADRAIRVPPCDSDEFIPRLLGICREEKAQLVVPTIDTELIHLAEHRKAFEAQGIRIAVSSPEVIRMARDKAATARFFKKAGIRAPKTGPIAEALENPREWSWPIVLKPQAGSGSAHVHIVRDINELTAAMKLRDDLIAQEKLSGREFTVHLYFDRDGKLRCWLPHWRREVRAGEVSKAVTWRDERIMAFAEGLGQTLRGAEGPICFQGTLSDEGEISVFELNARFGGGFPLAHRAGAQFPKWLMEEVLTGGSSAHNHWRDGLTMLRYDAAVFLPPEP